MFGFVDFFCYFCFSIVLTKNRNMKKIIFILLSVMLMSGLVKSQDKVELTANIDIASQYVWRGCMVDNKPNIQPAFSASYKNFEVGVANSISLINNFYETDLSVKYKFSDCLSLGVVDYYVDVTTTNVFDYSDSSSYHNLSADLVFGGTNESPLLFTVSTVIYGGLDVDEGGLNRFTTYFEVAYVKDKYELFLGGVTDESKFYGNKDAGIINVGVKVKREVKVSDTFTLPINIALVVNPQMKGLYVAGIIRF